MAKPWPERPVSAANKSGKQQVTRRNGAPPTAAPNPSANRIARAEAAASHTVRRSQKLHVRP